MPNPIIDSYRPLIQEISLKFSDPLIKHRKEKNQFSALFVSTMIDIGKKLVADVKDGAYSDNYVLRTLNDAALHFMHAIKFSKDNKALSRYVVEAKHEMKNLHVILISKITGEENPRYEVLTYSPEALSHEDFIIEFRQVVRGKIIYLNEIMNLKKKMKNM